MGGGVLIVDDFGHGKFHPLSRVGKENIEDLGFGPTVLIVCSRKYTGVIRKENMGNS